MLEIQQLRVVAEDQSVVAMTVKSTSVTVPFRLSSRLTVTLQETRNREEAKDEI